MEIFRSRLQPPTLLREAVSPSAHVAPFWLPSQNGLTLTSPLRFQSPAVPSLPISSTMIITRTYLPPEEAGLPRTQVEVFVAECEACGFSAVSHYEHDAVAIVERHQVKCSKFQADKSTHGDAA